MTGTGIVPEDSFTLQAGDEIRITIDGNRNLAQLRWLQRIQVRKKASVPLQGLAVSWDATSGQRRES